jgi:two-component system OmpR family response regulator
LDVFAAAVQPSSERRKQNPSVGAASDRSVAGTEGPVSRLLMIDDEPGIRKLVSRTLSSAGFEVDCAADGRRGLDMAREGRHELVLLDLMLPGMDGVSVLRSLMAERPAQRVLILSAVGDVTSKVRCLELGAADYLPKPFAVAELVARVRARLRQPAAETDTRFLRAGGLTLDTTRRTAEHQGKTVVLSERELLLLEHLMRRAGDVCRRETLLADVWGYAFDPGTNVVDVYVGRLRGKLGGDLIETIRNVGYCFAAS